MLILVKMRFPSSLYSIYISPNLLSISQTVRKLCSTEKSDFYGSLTFLSSAVNSFIPFLTLRASQKSGLYTPMLISSNQALILQALVQCVSNCLTCSLWQYSQIKVMVQQYKHLPLSRSNILSSLFILCNYSEVWPYICYLLFIVNTRPQSSSILILVAFQGQFDVR